VNLCRRAQLNIVEMVFNLFVVILLFLKLYFIKDEYRTALQNEIQFSVSMLYCVDLFLLCSFKSKFNFKAKLT